MSMLGGTHALRGFVARRWPRSSAAAEARRQQALAGLAVRALEGADSDDLVTYAAVMLARILDVPYSAALVWEPDERTMRVRAGVGWRAGVVNRLVIDAAALPQAAEAWRGWDPVVFERLERDPRMADVSLLRSHEIVSGLSVVVEPRGRPYGVLAAYTDKRRAFRPAEIEFVRAAAKILAIALGREYGERALFEEMQMSTVLAHVGRELMSCADVPILLARICELTAQALHCDHSVTWLHGEDEDGFRPVANDGLPGVQWETLGSVVLPSDAVAVLLEDLAHRETVRLAVPSARHPLLSALLERSGIRRALFAAIHKGDHVVGLQMSGHRDRGSEFGLQDERVAHGIAQLASMALMKARGSVTSFSCWDSRH
jgi:GAF domain-containing protein